jgi:hypothetical protein
VQTRDQLAEVEGLGQIVVRARLQTGDAVVDRVAGRQHADGDVVAQRTQRRHDRHPVQLRHLDVQHQGVMALTGEQPQCFLAVRRDPDVESRMP